MPVITKQTSIEIQKSVVFTIFIREIRARFGRYAQGYIWALLEPLVFVIVLIFLRTKIAVSPIASLPPSLFFTSGVLPLLLFRNIVISGISSVESNVGLFNYQRVKPADIFVARLLMEVMIFAIVSLLVFPAMHATGVKFSYNNILQTLAVLTLLLMLASGLGLILTVLGPIWAETSKVVPMLLRPLMFISGCVFSISALPPAMRVYFTWNPVLHAIELLRGAAFSGYTPKEVSWMYLSSFSLITFALGLSVYRIFRIHIVTSGTIR